jgi:hypothetical protein
VTTHPPTLVWEATKGTFFAEFVFPTWIFRMYRIGEMAGRWQGNGTAKAPEDMAGLHRPRTIWRGFILGILYIDVQNILRHSWISLTCPPLTKGVSSGVGVPRAPCGIHLSNNAL